MFVRPLCFGPRGLVYLRRYWTTNHYFERNYELPRDFPYSAASKRFYSNHIPISGFKGDVDRFNGVTVDTSQEPCDHSNFKGKLVDSLKYWNVQGKRCIWFKVKIEDAFQIPVLADQGFNFHHARDSYVMMYKWLPSDSGPNLPPSSHTNLGVGAMVFNDNNQILAVSEKHYEYPHWKLPGGYVERGEDIVQAARREVKEETGVEAEFRSLVTFRHTHNMMYGNSDVYMLVSMRAVSDTIMISDREVNLCQWMDIKEYITHPHVHEWNRLVVQTALGYKDRKLKLDLKKKTVKWAQNTRQMTFLVVEGT